ncbi:MAG: rhamnulokinase, partial [Odoribacteraceae bacterium]|nr:rhamnulokinase [Odoribacteraceae bacterium]
IGGGARNNLLNAFTANALGVPVIAGPPEATATGNVLLQAMAAGLLPDLAAARALVRDSIDATLFYPEEREQWERAGKLFSSHLIM